MREREQISKTEKEKEKEKERKRERKKRRKKEENRRKRKRERRKRERACHKQKCVSIVWPASRSVGRLLSTKLTKQCVHVLFCSLYQEYQK